MNDDKPESVTDFADGLPPVPPVDDDAAESAEPDLRVNEPSAMDVFFAWEKLRLLFNAILFGWLTYSISALRGGEFAPKLFFASVFVFNVCFCVGPTGEGYLCWVGTSRRFSRGIMLAVIALSALVFFAGMGVRRL